MEDAVKGILIPNEFGDLILCCPKCKEILHTPLFFKGTFYPCSCCGQKVII